MRNALAAGFLCLALAIWGACALAQEIDVDALAKRPGFLVTKKVINGKEVVEIRKATVTINIDKDGMMGVDQDTAVLCVWSEYVNLHIGADYCFPDGERELKEDFADAVEHFKDFIVANSLTPVTRSDLDAYVEKRRAELISRMSKTAGGAPRCPKLDFFVDYQADGRKKRRADVAKILAIPRPPVMNPCF